MLSIGSFSKISQVTTNTLRYYDEIGLLKPKHVNSENGYRYYDAKQLDTILFINKLKLYSFTLEEISEVLKEEDHSCKLLSFMTQKQYQLQEKVSTYQYALNQLQSDMLNIERGINIMSYLNNISIKLIETEERNILFVREKINVQEYGKNIGKVYEKIAKDNYTILGPPMSIYHDEEFNPECSDIEIGVPVKEKTNDTRILPTQLCAISTLKGPYSELNSVYTKLKQWIDDNKYAISASPFEIYLGDPGKNNPKDLITEVYFPVKKI